MEIWDIYDINKTKTGEKIYRGNALGDGKYHLVVHACLFDFENKMLIQQRQFRKKPWAGFWDISVGGNAVESETSERAIKREAFEEISYNINANNLKPKLTLYNNNKIEDFYIFKDYVKLESLKLQSQEVNAVTLASKDYIKKLQSKGFFVPYPENLIDLFFEFGKEI